MVTLHSGSWGYSKFIQNSKYSKVNQKPGPIFKTLVTHSYPLELCSSTMYPTLFAITTNTMCKAQQGGSLFKTQDNTKDFLSINTLLLAMAQYMFRGSTLKIRGWK